VEAERSPFQGYKKALSQAPEQLLKNLAWEINMGILISQF
jgi:hypothetical protein